MKIFARVHHQSTRSYSRYTDGIELLKECNTVDEIAKWVQYYEDMEFFPQDNGTVQDSNGNVVFKSGWDSYEYGDYHYMIVDTEDLDDYHDGKLIEEINEFFL